MGANLILPAGSAAADSTPADPVVRSLRFDQTSRLSRSTGSTNTTWTLAFWVKRALISGPYESQYLACWAISGSSGEGLAFRGTYDSSNLDRLSLYNGSTHNYSDRVFRDPSAWAHICISVNSGTGTVYYNGESVISGVSGIQAWGSMRLAEWLNDANEFDGYMADVYGIEGSALDHTSFTESNDYGGLKPKAYTGSFGTNGFHIDAQPAHDADLLVSSIDRNDGDTAFADAAAGHTITATGDPEHSDTVGNPFDTNGTAIHFDGSDALTIDDGSDLDFSSGVGTWEGWFNFTSIPSSGNELLFGKIATPNDGWFVGINSSGNLRWFDSVNNSTIDFTSKTLSTGTWYHVALCGEGSNTYRLYVDGTAVENSSGVSAISVSGSIDTNYDAMLGRGYHNYADYYIDGYVFDFRYQKGVDTSGAKPTAPFELNPVYLGGDQSGNKNHFTPTNISSHDVMLDTPTRNYATFNPLYNDNHSASNKDTLTEGNCEADYTTGSSGYYTPTTVGFSTGKFYFEVYVVSGGSGTMVGVVNESATGYVGSDSNGVGYHDSNGTIYNNGNTGTSYSTFTTGDIIGCAFDADTKKVWFAKNNSWNGSPTAGTGQAGTLSGTLFAAIRAYTGTLHINAGADPTFAGNKTSGQDTSQSEFYYAPPTGFKSLNTSNLGTPTVTPEENFNIALYNGNSSSNAITGLGFQPDLLYTKSRSTSGSSPKWFDSLRGVTKRLETNTAGAETTQSTELTSFDSDGFTLGSGSGSNYSGRTYVGWCWKAHQSPTSNTTTYTVKVEDNSGDAWDSSGTYYDSSTYLPSVYMEIFENRNSSLVSLGKVAVRYYDSSGNSNSDLSEQTYTLECADLNAIAVKWYYDTSGDGQQYDSPNSYNDYLNDQKITILDGATSEWTTNNYSNADGTSYNYSPPSGWANGDTLKAATTSYNGSDTATLTSGGSSGPTEQYNADAGFTIISYAGDGSTDGDTQTLDHSLGVPLEFVIAKARTSNDGYDTGNWIVWHKDLATGGKYLYLNSSSAQRTEASGYNLIRVQHAGGGQHQVVVNNGSDNSSYNYNYLNSGPDNGTGEDYILYGWAGVEGYSKFGKYTGNGSTDGPFIYTGFRPAFVLWKRISGSSNSWNIMDNKREGYNPQNDLLFPDTQGNESNVTDQDLLSNGFKLRTTGAGRNASSETFIYAAFAESPFKHANAR